MFYRFNCQAKLSESWRQQYKLKPLNQSCLCSDHIHIRTFHIDRIEVIRSIYSYYIYFYTLHGIMKGYYRC